MLVGVRGEQRHAHLVLQCMDPAGQRRLGDVQALKRGAANVLLLGNRNEVDERTRGPA